MAERTLNSHRKTCKAMVAVVTAMLMLMLLLMMLVLQCCIAGKLLVAMCFCCRCTGNIALYDFIVSKRLQLPGNHHSACINRIGNKYGQQQKYKTA